MKSSATGRPPDLAVLSIEQEMMAPRRSRMAVTVAPWPTRVCTQVSGSCFSAQTFHTLMVRSALPVKSRPRPP